MATIRKMCPCECDRIISDDAIDSDEYDYRNEANEPTNSIWDGSEIKWNPFGKDPSMPDFNDAADD